MKKLDKWWRKHHLFVQSIVKHNGHEKVVMFISLKEKIYNLHYHFWLTASLCLPFALHSPYSLIFEKNIKKLKISTPRAELLDCECNLPRNKAKGYWWFVLQKKRLV